VICCCAGPVRPYSAIIEKPIAFDWNQETWETFRGLRGEQNVSDVLCNSTRLEAASEMAFRWPSIAFQIGNDFRRKKESPCRFSIALARTTAIDQIT
jgi:hypothetical protein